MVAFGVAPAVLVYQWGVVRISEYGHEWRQFGWVIAFFYALCAALRLARFQHALASGDKRYFEGLAEPVGRPPWSHRSSGSSASGASRICPGSCWRSRSRATPLRSWSRRSATSACKQIDVDARVKYLVLSRFVILPMLILIAWDPPTHVVRHVRVLRHLRPGAVVSAQAARVRAARVLPEVPHGTAAQRVSRRARHRSLGSAQRAAAEVAAVAGSRWRPPRRSARTRISSATAPLRCRCHDVDWGVLRERVAGCTSCCRSVQDAHADRVRRRQHAARSGW